MLISVYVTLRIVLQKHFDKVGVSSRFRLPRCKELQANSGWLGRGTPRWPLGAQGCAAVLVPVCVTLNRKLRLVQ